MAAIVRYLSHPQVAIEPGKQIHRWSLNDLGKARVVSLANSGALFGTTRVISSAETKAVETASPLAAALGCSLEVRAEIHENDRRSTGFLPLPEFEIVADQFFAHPNQSIRGWETALAAQMRILHEVNECLERDDDGDILIVGHGGVGTLLFCALSGLSIDRKHDQGSGWGGCYFSFDRDTRRPLSAWQPMERMYETSGS